MVKVRKPIPFPTPAEQAAEARRQGYEPDDGKRLSDYGLTASDIEIEAPQKRPTELLGN